ncbi:retrovirus-related pol polyprotein from transposon TNT 1-94 [Tanacetum coccineum]
MYMEKIQDVLHPIDDNSGPTYDAEPLEKVHAYDDYNVFATERHHYEQPESINNIYVVEMAYSNISPDSTDMSGFKNHPLMLNKENYVPWSSRLFRYAKSRPNEKLIYNSIINGPCVRRMIPEPGDAARTVRVPETFHEQTDDELTKAEIKQIKVDDQAIQSILLGLPEDIYATKKAKLLWERFTSTEGESIESYYHRFLKLMNDFKRNKHFLEKIASNLKFLNNLQLEWSRHVTIVHQTKDLHTADYTQLYDFLKYNQKVVDELRAKRLAKTQNPLALMANSNNPFNYPVFQPDLPSSSTFIQQALPNNNYNPQPSFNQNYMQQPMPNPEGITDPTTAINMALIAQPGIQLQAKKFDLMAAAADLDEIEEVNANCILMANLPQVSTSVTQSDKAPVHDSDGSGEVQLHDKFYDNEIFNMFTQEEQYTEILEPILEPHQVLQNDSNVTSVVSSVEQGVDITTKTRRSQPRSNTKNDRVPSTSKSSRIKNKEVEVEDHPRNLLLFKNKKHMSFEWSKERLASPKPSKPRMRLRWSPTGKMFDIKGKLIASSESNGDNACTPNPQEPTIKRFPNSTFSLGRNDHVASILDLEVAFRRNTCFIRNLKGVDLLKGNRTTNLYTINLHDMASASPICLMARATFTKSWLWHQRLSHLNFDTINDLARNNLVTGLPKFKYHKEHLCPSCEQGKSKRASHPPKPVPNSKQRLHLLHMDLCGPMRIASINGNRSARNDVVTLNIPNPTCYNVRSRVVEQRNRTLVEAARTMLIFSLAPLFLWAEAIATACYTQNRSIIHYRFDKTPHKLINGRKPDISFLHVFGTLCYPKNDREDIGKLGAKGDTDFFIGYSANSCAYRVYNQRTKKIMETMNVTFDELSAMDVEQSSFKPGLQSMTSGQISSRLDLPYAPSIITSQKPTEGELDSLFEAMYDGHTPMETTTIADTAPTPTYSSSQATNCPNTSHDVDELETQQQHVQHQAATIADNVPNAMFDDNMFVNPFATPSTSAAESSSSQYVDPSNMHTRTLTTSFDKDHLRSDGDMCMYALTVSTMEPKNVKEAITDPAWIESMQEKLLQFKRLDNGRLVRIFLAYAAHKERFTVFSNGRENGLLAMLKNALRMVNQQAPKAWYDEIVPVSPTESLLQSNP